jgi:integral membrane protein
MPGELAASNDKNRQAVSMTAPIHGAAFIIYFWMLIQARYTLVSTPSETLRMVLSAFIPLAGFFNERALSRRQDRLSGTNA